MPAKKKPDTPKRIRMVFNHYEVIQDIIYSASQRACNRHDKYSDKPLSESSRSLLINEFEQSFWLAVSDANVEFKS